MYCVNKNKKAAPIKWSELEKEVNGLPEDEQKIIRENVRRDLIEFQIPRICDSYCRFPSLIKDEYALGQVCGACPVVKVSNFLEVIKEPQKEESRDV